MIIPPLSRGVLLAALFTAATLLPAADRSPVQDRADRFLVLVNASYQALSYVEQEAQWAASTDVSDLHDAAYATASKASAAFMGNPALISETKALLLQRHELDDLSVRQLEKLLLLAAEQPMTNPTLTQARIEAETKQASTLNGFEFQLNGKPVSVNEIDNLLQSSTDLAERQAVWLASKESGRALKDGLIQLRGLRNGVAQELGYSDYFALQVASYGMTTEEMVKLNDGFMEVLRPLYLQLHTWAKYKLAEKYGQPVPKRIPAHWIANRWGQEWDGLADGADLTAYFKKYTPEWVARSSEEFYVGLGFPALPKSFWEKSDLYPVPAGSTRKKNTHASAWHLDIGTDLRSLQSIEANPWWFTTNHHEFGHIYYFMAYTRPEVPVLLRDGANPAFHEGFGELTALAAGQVPYLKSLGVLPADFQADETAFLLGNALAPGIPFIYWSSGVMTHWEADIYAHNLPADQWNARWWQYVRDFQGIEPPVERGEEWCDAATKTHINDTPAYYYTYAIAQVFKHQLHDHIARKILKQPPQNCNYAGNKEVGDFLRGVMEKGQTEDWRKVLKEATGEDFSTRAMLDYYAPLMDWLVEQNKGRPIGWE
ncbi:Angiotensin-converting enzyme [Lacunisphaera limnophila]|uniref:Angiotensin-converting enzyme n=1 Tax=Lacunisphaera limnophila TaxID=1838286 RepID=A0A1D8AR51_9BACT|nr:M2 family metallopeptidase [Lacunisphaera limnophila]AOS43365.1 Angiotensin-converting enzyme [Lacunisphaera limnophila]